MKIPTSFKQYGRTVTVEYIKDTFHESDAHGWAKYRSDKITLQPCSESTPITRAALEHNFCHELMHHILYNAGEDDFDPPLHKREWLVDRIGGLLHQALSTATYKDDTKSHKK